MNPLLGERVIYVSKIDNSEGGHANKVLSPATVLRTQDTNVPAVVARWGADEPTEVGPSPVDGKTHLTAQRPEGVLDELPDRDTVDLLVHGLGKDYREYGVQKDLDGGLGTWHPMGNVINIDAGPAPFVLRMPDESPSE